MSRIEGLSTTTTTTKRRRVVTTWRDLPEFCDAAASVSASTFGARRLPELRALYRQTANPSPERNLKLENALVSGGCKTSSRHLRRRATSYASRQRHRPPMARNEELVVENGKSGPTTTPATVTPSSRRKRRKIVTLRQEHESWKHEDAAITNDSSIANKNPIHFWIPCHVWHAKRFAMESLWGWKVPILHCNRGSKAALRLVREGKCLVQDVTWTSQPIYLSFLRSQIGDVQSNLRRIIPDFAIHETEEEEKMKDGTVYHVDAFPLRAVGPVQYAAVKTPLFSDVDGTTGSMLHLYVWTHVSIRAIVQECMKNAIGQLATLNLVPGGVSRIQLRGRNVASDLLRTLSNLPWCTSALHDTFFPDGSISEEVHGIFTPRITYYESKGINPSHPSFGKSIRCVIQCPRDPSLTCNYGCYGMDVFCPPFLARELWQALVTTGGACPIGLVEACHLALEACPPMPVFPRDFPDTGAGVEYWTGSSSEWKLYRSCLEAGSGRISRQSSKCLGSVDWSTLVDKAEQNNAPVQRATAVIRGSFGQPFLQLMQGAVPNLDSSVSPRKRNRRKLTPADRLIILPPPSRNLKASYESTCHSLLQSLSLPAMILCHVVLGKGTLTPGMLVLDGQEKVQLGHITAGSFSHCRGTSHGLAICGAARLLQSMTTAYNGSFVLGRCPDGTRQCRLAVMVRGTQTISNSGSLSFLFSS